MTKKNVYLLGLTSLLNDASSEGVYTLLPLILRDPFLVGVVGGIFNGLAYMIKPLSGYLSDRLGKAKPLIVFGYLLSSVARTLIAFLPNLLIPVAVVIDRIGKGIRDAPRDVLLSFYKKRGWAFGLHRALDTTGAVMGVLLATFLVSLYGLDERSAVLILALLGFATLVPLAFVREERRPKVRESLKESLRETSRELGTTFWIAVLVGLTLVTPALFIDRAVDVIGASGIALYAAFNVVYALSAYFIGKKSDEIGRKTVLGTGLIAAALAHLLIPLEDTVVILASFLLYGLAFGALLPTVFARAGDRVRKEIGTGLGVVQFGLGLAMLFASVLGGVLVSVLGYPALSVFVIPAMLALLMLPGF